MMVLIKTIPGLIKWWNVYDVKDAIGYKRSEAIIQRFFSQTYFYFKTPDGSACNVSPSYCE